MVIADGVNTNPDSSSSKNENDSFFFVVVVVVVAAIAVIQKVLLEICAQDFTRIRVILERDVRALLRYFWREFLVRVSAFHRSDVKRSRF